MAEQKVPDMSGSFSSNAQNNGQYQIWFRAIDIDMHLSRLVSNEFDKGTVEKGMGIEHGIGSFANHEYIEIMGPKGLDTRFHGLGVVNDPNHPTGFKMTPDDRLVALVANTPYTPVEMDPIFYDDANFDQENHAGQLQKAEDPGENMMALTVNETQMLQIKLALLNASNQLNADNPGFGLLGQWDPNSNSYAATMRGVVLETAGKLGIDTSGVKAFDPDGWSPGADNIIKTKPVELFNGSLSQLRDAVKHTELENAQQLSRLRQAPNINELDLNKPANAGVQGMAVKP